jgi:hypothetical protein
VIAKPVWIIILKAAQVRIAEKQKIQKTTIK